tara:strand:+ start:375 stop:527 length:153 start_codon:yes stop_codon:yes gene_type:complete
MKIFFTIIGSFLFLFSNFVYADSNKKTTLTGLSEIAIIVDIDYSNESADF